MASTRSAEFELLTPAEERELAIKLQDSGDPQYAYRLVTANLRLVVKIALEHRGYYRNLARPHPGG
ncbi:MAG: hypothetical protein M0C28_41150 [Candidatus Moduliflexus flocculans]|nr:hypothetical protein [Candidatus Moduliflexus flocculans]